MTGMKFQSLLAQIALGEDFTRQFKVSVKNADSLASEMVAFANTNGGTTFIDVADDCGDHDGCLFTATVHRKPVGELDLVNIAPEGSLTTDTASGKRRESVGENVGQNHLSYQR